MATGKRYYWVKLTDKFMNDDVVDYLMQQTNGSNYVVLYQMMCLSTKNNNGKLCTKIGELLLRWDEDKIARECKWFSVDTIRVALILFQKLGLIYEENDGVLVISDFDQIVGSESDYAAQKRLQRSNVSSRLPVANIPQIESKNGDCDDSTEGVDNVHGIVHIEKEKEKEKDKEKEKEYSSVLSLFPLERREALKNKLCDGIIFVSREQWDRLCELLSFDELVHYCEVIKKDEREGRHYTKRTHYQAIIDMCEADRRL